MTQQPINSEEMLSLYAQAPTELEAVLQGLSTSELDKPQHDGSWTLRQTVHHIVDGDIIWTTIMKIALISTGSPFNMEGYKSNDQTADTLRYTQRAIEPALHLFKANRTQMGELFSLLPDALANTISLISPQGPRPVSVQQMIAIQATHAMEHMQEIRTKLAQQ